MILTALVDYYKALEERGEVAEPGWCQERVSYALNISKDGKLLDILHLKEEVTRGKKTVEVPQVKIVPERVVKSSGVLSNFLCENSTYMLGIDQKGKPDRTISCFQACKNLHLEVLQDAIDDNAIAIRKYFEHWDPTAAEVHPALQTCMDEITSQGNIIFLVDGEIYGQDVPEVKELWDRYYSSSSQQSEGICLVTGKKAPLARLHGKIKGVPGAQAAGANLVSFNAPSFHSYGAGEDESDAPISEQAVFAYTTALNYLISSSEHKQVIGDTMMVYWAEGADRKAEGMFKILMSPSYEGQDQAEATIHGVFKKMAMGAPVDDVDMEIPFYVLGLSPNAARLSVRFFLRNTFGEMLNNLKAHYERLEIAKAPYERRYLYIPDLLKETVNPNSKDKSASPLMSGAVLQAVLSGQSYPEGLYYAVLGRIRAEQDNEEKRIRKITSGRAAIVKAYLCQRLEGHKESEVLTVSLNTETNNKAYVLGRLFSVLEMTQSKANPEITATIKDRYFSSASATPAYVFPNLLKLSQAHIKKIRSKTGKADYYQIRISELMNKLEMDEAEGQEAFPTRLSPQDQGIFILGYYHENQERYTKKKEEETDGSDSE